MEDSDKVTYFAETDTRNKRVKFGIKAEDRLRHIYSIGKTGMGKSTMLENMAIQDIQNGEGVAFLDPHGKTADLLLDYVPEHRMKDVIYFAPFDAEYPISFNVMEDVGLDRRHLVVSGLMSAFEKIWEDQWSSRMAYILQNTLAALLEYPGATILGINRMLTDKVYRNKVVDNVKDPTVRAFWVGEFAKYTERFAAEATPAIQNKVGQFISNPLIRNIIGQSESSFDVRKIMDERKILIVNLSKGLVGESNANLLGAMLVTKIYLAAMSRADADPKELKKLPNFYLYADEFQSFANKSFADILSEARKYKLSLNITHQYIEQMAEEVRAAVFGNVGTMITFRVGSYDAEILEKEFAPVFTMEDIVNLGFVQIYLKLMIDGVASQPFSATTLPPFPKPEISFRDKVMEMSRKTYAKPKADIEKTIREWHLPDLSMVKPNRTGALEQKYEIPDAGHEARKEPKPELKKYGEKRESHLKPIFQTKKEIRGEVKIEETKLGQPRSIERKIEHKKTHTESQYQEHKNTLAEAMGEAVKTRNTKIEKEEKPEIKIEKKQIVSLRELRHREKNRNKEATPENRNALKEAIQKAGSLEVKTESKEKKEEASKPQTPSPKLPNEVPEETLRKILEGQ